jgi:hypothetical protein
MNEDFLEIISDEEDDCSSDEEEKYQKQYEQKDYELCYYCQAQLEYEENEFYDLDNNCYYCERCWYDIHYEED